MRGTAAIFLTLALALLGSASGEAQDAPALPEISETRAQGYDPTETIAKLQALADEQPSARNLDQLGMALNRAGRGEEAAEVFRKGVQLDSHSVDAWDDLAVSLFTLGRKDEAMDAFHQGLQFNPAAGLLWADLAASQCRDKKFTDAGTTLAAAFRAVPNSAEVWSALGVLRLDTGDNVGAVAAFRRALAISPDFINAWNNLCEAEYRAGQPAQALADAEQAARTHPQLASFWFILLKIAGLTNQAGVADDAGHHSLAINPAQPTVWAMLGELNFSNARYDEAVKDYGQAIDQWGFKDPGVMGGYAESLAQMHQADAADQVLVRAEALYPNNEALDVSEGAVRSLEGRNDDALAAFNRALALKPDDSSVMIALGAHEERVGQTADAIEEMQKAVAASPSSYRAWAGLGLARQGVKDRPDAAAAFRRALLLLPGSPQALWGVEFNSDDPVEKEDVARRLVAVEPTEVQAWRALIMAEVVNRNYSTAEADARKLTALAPTLPSGWFLLGVALGSQERWDEAITALQQEEKVGTNLSAFERGEAAVKIGLCEMGAAKAQNNPGKWQAAEDQFQQVLTIAPYDAGTYYQLMRCQQALHQDDQAKASMDKLLALGRNPRVDLISLPLPTPHDIDAGLGLLQACNLIAHRHAPQALAVIQVVLAQKPHDANTQEEMVLALLANGRCTDAIDEAKKMAADHPGDDPDVLTVLGQTQGLDLDYTGAAQSLERSVKVKPAQPVAWTMLASAYDKLRDNDKYRDAALRGLAVEPHTIQLWLHLRFSYRDDLAGAETKLEELLDPHPDWCEGWSILAQLQLDRAMNDAALASARKAKAGNFTDPKIWTSLGALFGKLAQYPDAEDCDRRAIQLNPYLAVAYSDLGYGQFCEGRVEDAIGNYKKALDLDPRNAPALYNLASAYAKQSNWTMAKDVCHQLSWLNPGKASELTDKFAAAQSANVSSTH